MEMKGFPRNGTGKRRKALKTLRSIISWNRIKSLNKLTSAQHGVDQKKESGSVVKSKVFTGA